MNILIILGVLFIALIVLVPLIEKTAKPVEEEQMQKYSKVIMGLMMAIVVAASLKFCLAG
ncbi:MAG: hypothetical protein HRU21_08615 [Pseudomonadales bacterium]|nr:hypothetical protein [Pseudomonadales bacterium]